MVLHLVNSLDGGAKPAPPAATTTIQAFRTFSAELYLELTMMTPGGRAGVFHSRNR
jgi:hypothetical protein